MSTSMSMLYIQYSYFHLIYNSTVVFNNKNNYTYKCQTKLKFKFKFTHKEFIIFAPLNNDYDDAIRIYFSPKIGEKSHIIIIHNRPKATKKLLIEQCVN